MNGGIERWFEPLPPALPVAPAWSGLLIGLGELFNQVRPTPQWFIEAHPFRIDTTDGVGRPTPEGAHRDGVDFVAVLLVSREGVKGGETRVFDADGPHGSRHAGSDADRQDVRPGGRRRGARRPRARAADVRGGDLAR